LFKLAHNGNVILNVAELNPPSAAFIVEALERSPYADCEVNHESIKAHFTSDFPEQLLVVAKQHDATFTVEVSEDQMQAIGKLTCARGGKTIGLEEAKKEIVKAGVNRGYKQIYLEQILKMQQELEPGTETSGIVAQGRPAENGQPAKILQHVQTVKERLKQPKLREDGTVDMRDFGALSSVAPGTLLITQRPATPGKEGFTVVGDTIAPTPGESFQLVAGEGTQISPTNPLELVATIAGSPSSIKNGMRVDDVFTIGEVNVRSGHVDFNGSVVVSHNVAPGMKIRAKGDITVMGSVESGELISGGNIEVKQAVIGHLDHKNNDEGLTCRLVADGNIHLSHCQYTYLEANNVFIDRQSNHCDIKANQLIQVGIDEQPKGKLIGGEIFDAQMIIAGVIGSGSGANMRIHLARSGIQITEQLDSCLKALSQTDEQLEALQQAIEKADMVKDLEKKQQLKAKIGATHEHYSKEAKALKQQVAQLELKLHNLLENTKLTANHTLNSGVEIHIFDRVYKTQRSYPPCYASLQDRKIAISFKTSA
jgi:uncharacterized protein (DUF342 family)